MGIYRRVMGCEMPQGIVSGQLLGHAGEGLVRCQARPRPGVCEDTYGRLKVVISEMQMRMP